MKDKTSVEFVDSVEKQGSIYQIYNVTIPIAVKNPRFESVEDIQGGYDVEHDGYFAAETLDEKEPFEFKGQETDIFNDELIDDLKDLLSH